MAWQAMMCARAPLLLCRTTLQASTQVCSIMASAHAAGENSSDLFFYFFLARHV